MSDLTEQINEQSVADEEKRRLSDAGMPMDQDEVPTGSREDGHEGHAVETGH